MAAQREIANLMVRIGADITQFEKRMNKAARMTERWGRRLSEYGRTLTAAVTLPLAAAGGALLKLGMDAVESENFFTTSLGNMAERAREWSEAISSELRLNDYEVRRQVATFYTMFESMKLGEQSAYQLATSLTQLAYDLGSFYNLPTEEAFQKLAAGITGEVEPLKRLGILVNEETVKQYAYANGIAKAGEQLTEQQKVMARYIAILDQTQAAQGDLRRTLGSPLNQIRGTQRELARLSTDIGMSLLPVLRDVLKAAQPFLEAVQSLANRFANLDEKTRRQIVTWFGYAAAIGPVIWGLGMISSSATAIIRLLPQLGKGLLWVVRAIPATWNGLVAVKAFGDRLYFGLQAWAGGASTFGEAMHYAGGASLAAAGKIVVVGAVLLSLLASIYAVIFAWDEHVAKVKAAWDLIGSITDAGAAVLKAGFAAIRLTWNQAVAEMAERWAEFVERVAAGARRIPGMGEAAEWLEGVAANSREWGRSIVAGAEEQYRVAARAIPEAVRRVEQSWEAYRRATEAHNKRLKEIFGLAGGRETGANTLGLLEEAANAANKELENLYSQWQKLIGEFSQAGGVGAGTGGAGLGTAVAAISDAGLVAARRAWERARAIGNTVGAQMALSIMEAAAGMSRVPAFAVAGGAAAAPAAPTVQLGGTIRVEVTDARGNSLGYTDVQASELLVNQDRYSPVRSRRRIFQE